MNLDIARIFAFAKILSFALCISSTAFSEDISSNIDAKFYNEIMLKLNEASYINGHNQNDSNVIVRFMLLHHDNSTVITVIWENDKFQNSAKVTKRRKTGDGFEINKFNITLDEHQIESLSYIIGSSSYGDLNSKVTDLGVESAPSLWLYEFASKSNSILLARQAPFNYTLQNLIYKGDAKRIQKFAILDTFGVMLWLLCTDEPLPADK